MMTNSKRLLSAAALCCYYATSTIIATSATSTIPRTDDNNLFNNHLQEDTIHTAKKRQLRGPPPHRTLQSIDLSTHPYYPTHTTKTCSNDGNPPSWMTWSGGYAEAHLFRTAKECCDKWFPDNSVCYVNGGYTGHVVEGEEGGSNYEDEEIVVENYHERPVITSTEEEKEEVDTSTATATRPTRPVVQATQQTKPTQPEATFPTSSCGTNLFAARECNRLCLPGGMDTCLPDETCFPNILCPATQVAAAMGPAGGAILDLISIPDELVGKANTVNVCGVDYNDAESKCKNVVTGEVYMDANYIECPDGTGIECPNEMQCFGGIMCALPPTVSPTVRPTTVKPTVGKTSATVLGGGGGGAIVASTTTVVRKDKTEVLGVYVPPPPTPIAVSSTSTSQHSSPYTIDKSTLGTVSVASESCTGGCPANSKCVGNQAAGQLIEDTDCQPCSASGQTWWPCDVPGLCWCWKDGTDRIAPAPPSGVEVDTTLGEHYTVCDDILTRETFDLIAPNARPPYTYTGLCDAILSYNAHHAEKAFGMGDAFLRASEIAAFLGNTLHESDEFKAPREYLMCGDNKVVNGEVYCKPCDDSSFDWGTKKCGHSLGTFSEYCQSSSKPPEACSCGTAQGDGDGYVPAKEMFFGRGAIQLSWNYNYRGASTALTGSPETFCENPDLVASEEKYAWGAGLFFWMEHMKEGTTSHTECLKNYNFGGTLNNINGGLECPAHGGWHAEAVKMRLNRYCRAAKGLGLPNLLKIDGCAGLDDKFHSCVGDGSCSECSDFYGKDTGDHSSSYSPPVSSPASTSVVEQPAVIEERPSESLCPEGFFPWEKNSSCCVPNPKFIGDGACDPDTPYNTEVCGYDGGDCCKGTCDPGSLFGCTTKKESHYGDYGPFGFYCIDPSQEDSIDRVACAAVEMDSIGDGVCNPEYNKAECNYDGGDCCKESCDTGHSFYSCGLGVENFDCRDPAFVEEEVETDNQTASAQTTETVTSTPAPTKISTPLPTKISTPPPTKATTAPPTPPPITPPTKPPITPPTKLPTKSPVKPPTSPPMQTTCHKDMLECEGGTFVTRNPDDKCEFHACPPVKDTTALEQLILALQTPKCEDELLECPGSGNYVGRDPANGCNFFPCPDPKPKPLEVEPTETAEVCVEDFFLCGGGQLVFRNPEDSCNFFPCPIRECKEDWLVCSGGQSVYRNPEDDCNFYPCPELLETSKPTPRPTPRRTPRPTRKPTPRPSEKVQSTSMAASVHESLTPRPTRKRTPRPTPRRTPRPTEKPTPRPSEKVQSTSMAASVHESLTPLSQQTAQTTMAGSVHDQLSASNPAGCTKELFRCSNGRYVGRDPGNKCEYFPCKEVGDGSEMSQQSSTMTSASMMLEKFTSEQSEQSSSMTSASKTHEKFTSNLNQALRTHNKKRKNGG